ncbi:MAG TPA: ABC transporter ATP-binding protein [Leptolyngbyaceae cyanobacterium M33_DOE_097]|uniref:ABC transporter ATP-binding protein n=1 Tax=Oscillatoriales cyanobacterium SpSt-418 TaxID=2282169 RepID=A0A7C3KIN9_9CYAN|nr:ABC transporter ATP-binding protein [Leptolyngbyaceae cyanobacterium M33_DOE_097]
MLVLTASHLRKTYREKKEDLLAVKDVSLQVAAGEVLAFLGPNGAGKTTSIKMIAGLILPDAGSVKILEQDPHLNPKALRLLGAVLEGNRNVYWRLTCQENLEYFGVLRGLHPKQARLRSQELLERFSLTHKRDRVVQALSRGMQQKLAIAVALMHQPPLLLLDEPTLGLDVEATEDVKRLVREIAVEGCAIVLTTHQLAIAEELSDRVAIINNGEVTVEESTDELIRQFSNSAYLIETQESIPLVQQQKLEALGVELESDRRIHLAEPTLLYPVLEILKPLPLLRVEIDQATLRDVFLKLIRQP